MQLQAYTYFSRENKHRYMPLISIGYFETFQTNKHIHTEDS